jgi:hypothetical protein
MEGRAIRPEDFVEYKLEQKRSVENGEQIVLFSICCSNLQFHWFGFKEEQGRSIYVTWRYCQIALNGKEG